MCISPLNKKFITLHTNKIIIIKIIVARDTLITIMRFFFLIMQTLTSGIYTVKLQWQSSSKVIFIKIQRKYEPFSGKRGLNAYWLVVWCLMPFSTVFRLYRGGQCIYPCFPGVLLTGTAHNILSKQLGAFPHNHCRNNGQRWESNESCRDDYHQEYWSSRGSNQRPPVQVRNATY